MPPYNNTNTSDQKKNYGEETTHLETLSLEGVEILVPIVKDKKTNDKWVKKDASTNVWNYNINSDTVSTSKNASNINITNISGLEDKLLLVTFSSKRGEKEPKNTIRPHKNYSHAANI